jgi:drug/metabolite transporter (DMT)-like permease
VTIPLDNGYCLLPILLQFADSMPASLKAYIFLLVTTLGWGGNAVIGKFAVGHIGPFTLSAARWLLALALITAISIPQIRKDWPQARRHLLLLLAYGAVGFASFNALLYTALKTTSAINCVIEQAGIPGVIFIANFVFFRVKAGLAQILGFTLTLFGVGLTATNGTPASIADIGLNYGDGLMVIAVLLYAGYSVTLRFKPAIHWKTLMAASALGAMLACLPLITTEVLGGDFIMPDAIGWAAILYTGTVPSLVSQVLYVRGVELIGSNRAGLFINAIPIFGILLSVIFLGEPLQNFHLAAMAMVLAGIVIAERGRR